MAFLELSNVSRSFGSLEVLRDVDLQIEKGEFVAIVGFSGSGKTTLISLIAGLLRPDRGTITLNDLEITAPGPDRGIVFQNYSLLPWLSAFENVFLAVEQAFPNWALAKKQQHTEKFLDLVHLSAARDKKPAELSGGMKQRVSVARALAMDPQILLLDEPLSALDALTRASLQDEIARIREETHKTVVLITNDPDEGIYLADRIIPLTSGPGATLGPSFPVDIPWPRDRKTINHHPQFKKMRHDICHFMLQSRREHHCVVDRTLILPAIEPEDLSLPRPIGGRRRPVRRQEIKHEPVEVETTSGL